MRWEVNVQSVENSLFLKWIKSSIRMKKKAGLLTFQRKIDYLILEKEKILRIITLYI